MAFFLILGSFLYYLCTLNGTVPAYRDSGDLINAVSTLGIAHPPGYPSYVVLGKLFCDLLPWGNIAYRVNVFSALCAAVSVGLLYLTSVGLLGGQQEINKNVKWACFLASICYALTPALLSLARVAEMYTLAGVFAVGILACFVAISPRSLMLGAFLLGCGFGVHPTLLVLAPLLLPYKLFQRGQGESGWGVARYLLAQLGFFALGFSIVLFLLIRSRQVPLQNWGNPSTFIDLWRLITRSNYGGLKLHPVESQFSWTASGLLAQTLNFFRTLVGQWGWAAILVGIFGVRRSSPAGRSCVGGWKLVVSWLLAGPVFFLLSNLPLNAATTAPILEPYLIVVNVITAVWVAQGSYLLFKRFEYPGIPFWVGALLIGFTLTRGEGAFRSFRKDYYAYDLGRNFSRSLPSQAILYDPDDPISFTLRSLQLIEHRREDLVLLNFFRTRWGYRQIVKRWPDLLPSVDIQNAQELERLLWSYSMKTRPIYADLPLKIPPGMGYRVEGLAYRVTSVPEPPTPEELKRAEDLFLLYPWRGVWRTTVYPDFFTRQIFNYRAAARCNLGLRYAEQGRWELARRCYQQALCIDPRLSAAYNDLGVADYQQGRYVQALENYQRALKYDPANPGYRRNLTLAQEAVSH